MIFCFEEDDGLRQVMLCTLEDCGYQVQGFKNKAELFDALGIKRPELIIADVMCEKAQGGEVLDELRGITRQRGTPLLVITTEWMECNRVYGIDLRDDRYLLRPFNGTQLVDAVEKALMSKMRSSSCVFEADGVKIECIDGDTLLNGTKINLRKKEHSLLKLFISYGERVLTRQQIFNTVWQSDYLGESRTVDVHVGSLRAKLGDAGKYIKTVSGKGYCMKSE